MSNHTRYGFTLPFFSILMFIAASSLGCASTTTAYSPEARNLAGTSQTPHNTEPMRVRETNLRVEHASAVGGGASMGMARRVRAR